jgi:hypothetical protein
MRTCCTVRRPTTLNRLGPRRNSAADFQRGLPELVLQKSDSFGYLRPPSWQVQPFQRQADTFNLVWFTGATLREARLVSLQGFMLAIDLFPNCYERPPPRKKDLRLPRSYSISVVNPQVSLKTDGKPDLREDWVPQIVQDAYDNWVREQFLWDKQKSQPRPCDPTWQAPK